jgi:hypothetical protein
MEGRAMKRTIVAITTSVALLAAGILYGGHEQTDYRKNPTLDEAYTAQFPEQIPNVVVDPMVGFPVC